MESAESTAHLDAFCQTIIALENVEEDGGDVWVVGLRLAYVPQELSKPAPRILPGLLLFRVRQYYK